MQGRGTPRYIMSASVCRDFHCIILLSKRYVRSRDMLDFFLFFICTDSEFTSFFCNVFFQVKMQTRCLKDLQGIWRFPSEFAYDFWVNYLQCYSTNQPKVECVLRVTRSWDACMLHAPHLSKKQSSCTQRWWDCVSLLVPIHQLQWGYQTNHAAIPITIGSTTEAY